MSRLKSRLAKHNSTQLQVFVILAGLGLVAELNHVHIPHTEALIDGRWAFGFMGFALLRRGWAALLLAAFLSMPFGSNVSFLVGFLGNMLYAIPSLLVIRPLQDRLLTRWGPGWIYGLGWLALVLFCYQAFTTPAVWGVIALIEHVAVWPSVLEGWRTQPYLIESILVGLFSGAAMVAVLAHQQLRRNQWRLEHLNRVLLGIRNVNQLIVSEEDPLRLIEKACENLTETLGYFNAWIVLLAEDGKTITASAASGFDGGFEAFRKRLERGAFPACMRQALERDMAVVVVDPKAECLDCPLSGEYGGRTGLSHRLTFGGTTYGILTVSVPAAYAHDDEAQNLFEEVAGDLAFALHKIETAELLRKSERRYREIFEGSRDGFVMVDPSGRIIDANQAFCDMLGYSLKELKDMEDFYRITPERWREWEAKEIWEHRLLAKGHSGLYEKEYIRKDGTVFPVELRSYAVRSEDGALDYLWGTVRDITERKRTEESLLHKQAMLSRTEQIANVGSWEWDIANDNVVWSEELFRIFGREPAESPPTFAQHAQLYVAEDMERLKQAVETCMSEGTPYELELRAFHMDGTIRHCIARGRAERDAEGRIGRLAGSLQDVTDRKTAEKALQDSENRYRRLFESAKDGILILDATTGKVVDVNPFLMQLLGYDYDSFLGKQIWEIGPFDHIAASKEAFIALKEQQYIRYDDLPLETADGRMVEVEFVSNVYVEDQTEVIQCNIRDITDRKKAESERERLLSAIEQAGEMIVITDSGGTIQYVNPAFERVTGYTRKEAVGQNPRMLKSGKQDRAFYGALWETISGGSTFQGRMVNRRKDGTLFTEESSIAPVRDASGRIVNYVAVKHDITEQLKLAEQYHQAQKVESIGRLAGGVAHDLNNLLSPILGYSEMLRDDLDPEDNRRESVNEIMSAGLRARDLVRQLLAFSRKQIMEFKPVDLNKVVAGLRNLVQRTIREDIEMTFAFSPAPEVIMADMGQVEQVIMNLAVNAADAMPEGGQLTIETSNVYLDEEYTKSHQSAKPGRHVMLAISDTGHGMGEETQEHIFEPFFSTKGEHGTGLGLSTVYGIVKQHGGNIWVYSEPGRGTTFKIYLPVADTLEAEEKARPEQSLDLKGSETILIVEDNDQVRHLAKSVLSRNGYRVLDAKDGGEALEILGGYEGPVHLLLSDVVLPGMNGKELYQEALEMRPSIKVLYMSGYTGNVIAHRGVLDEGVQFIQKPFTVHGLATKVRELLDEK